MSPILHNAREIQNSLSIYQKKETQMKRLKELADFIEKNEQEQVATILQSTYPNIDYNIIYYFLARHVYKDGLFDQFEFLDLQKCKLIEIEISNFEVFNLVEYADFCTYKEIDFAHYCKLGFDEPYFFATGTWPWPIVTTPINGKLVTMDGNNRLRQLRCYLNNTPLPKTNKHKIYILEQED